MKKCILNENKICNNCGDCDDRCSLDPRKVCDNCFKCLDSLEQDYAEIKIDGVYLDPEDAEANRPL